ncbi:hypothetical protein EDD16DRAFT_1519623 [Pisolithus croceorrhizus]|nr:hypothetical protein EDD16DRAFT_1519623 [Pisolithus croceorrhizus]
MTMSCVQVATQTWYCMHVTVFSLSTLPQTKSTRPKFSKQSFDNGVNALVSCPLFAELTRFLTWHLMFAMGTIVNVKVNPQRLTFSTGTVVNVKYWPNIHTPSVIPEMPSAVIIGQSSGPLMPTHCTMSSQRI